MTKKPLNISEEAAVQMPMKTVASLIAIIAIGTWAYFGIHEKLNQHSTQIELMQKDLEQNIFVKLCTFNCLSFLKRSFFPGFFLTPWSSW